MTLNEYIEKEKTDRNLYFKLSTGEIQNLLDEAIELLDYQYETIEDFEKELGEQTDCKMTVNQAFRDGWNMARMLK